MKAKIQFLYLIMIIITLPIKLISQDWPSWRGPNRNSITDDQSWSYETIKGNPNILWKINVGKGYSSVTVQGNKLYTMGNTELVTKVFCINTKTGKEVWQFEYDCPDRYHYGSLSTPVFEEGSIYVFGINGEVFCLDANTGNRKWQGNVVDQYGAQKPKYGFTGSPVIEDDLVILNAGQYGIALNKHTGKKVWGSDSLGKAGYATPVIYTYQGEKCAMIFSHRKLNAVRILDGKLLWSFPWVFNDGADSPDPVVVGHRVFISTAYRNGAAMIDFKDNKPTQKWFKKEIQNEFGSSIYVDGYLFIPDGDTRHKTAYLKCVDFNTGKEMWSWDTGHCSIININNKFIILNQWGQITVSEANEKGHINLETTKIVETSEDIRCWTAPVLADGKLYVRTNTGELVCVYLRSTKS
ncbi:MAG: PQQ-binding-like beta-propeller repeat protein [Tenuifilaceae bacterium]